MSTSLLRVVILALALALLAGGTPARAGSVQRALSDTNGAPTPSLAAVTLGALKRTTCPKRPAARRPHPPATRTAIRNAKLLLSRRSSVRKLARVLNTRRGSSAIALAGLNSAKPGIALAGFLSAQGHHPRDPLPLLDAAVIMSRLGHQPEALALLDAAQHLHAGSAPLGIDVRSLIDNARGVALFRLGRLSDAAALFRSASRRAPHLPHPKRNLAAALLCLGRTQAAVQPYIDGTFADPVHTQAPASSTATMAPPVPADALDLSQGVAGTLPALKIPVSADAGADSAVLLQAAFDRTSNQAQQAFQQATKVLGQLSTEQAPLLAAHRLLTVRRTDTILGLSNNWKSNRPDIAALYTKVEADQAHMQSSSPGDAVAARIQGVHNGCIDTGGGTATIKQCQLSTCGPAVRSAHTDWLPQAQAYDADVRAWAAEFYRYKSALAANLKSPTAGAAITVGARQQMLVVYQGELLAVSGMAGFEQGYRDCLKADDPSQAAGDDGTLTAPDADPCSSALAAVKFTFSLTAPTEPPTVFGFSVSCENVGIEVSLPTPITPYGSLKYDFASGSTTAFVGVKGGVDLDSDIKASVKGGVYMTWDSSGNPTDCGIQVSGPGVTGKWDSVKIGNAQEPKVQVSVAEYLL